MLIGVALAAALALGRPAAPAVAEAQGTGNVPRIGVVAVSEPASPTEPNLAAFRQGLRDLGYVEGQNLVVEYRYAQGRTERAPELVAELVGLKVDVIVASGPTAIAAKNATQTIPIVCVAMADPVRFGLVASLARPGGNVTGLALNVDTKFIGKWLELLKEAAPRASRIGYLHDSNMGLPGPDLAELKSTLRLVDVRELRQIETAFAEIGKDRGGVVVSPQPFFFAQRSRIAELATKHRVPAIYGFRAFVDAGGLMSYGMNLPDVWRRAATYVDKILKGAKPSDLPVEQPTKYELLINRKAAKALDLTVPRSLLLRADEVIE